MSDQQEANRRDKIRRRLLEHLVDGDSELRVALESKGFDEIKLLAEGNMAAVYSAVQGRLDRRVAIKVLSSRLNDSPAFIERFENEGRILARLKHPNIVSVYQADVCELQNGKVLPYFVMELVEGEDLRSRLRFGTFPAKDVKTIATQICNALSIAHKQNIIHRDIKPENILLDKEGRVKVADFGISRDLGLIRRLTIGEARLRTPGYVAPEVENGQDADQRSDVYSCGVVLYEMLRQQNSWVNFGSGSSPRL